LNKERRSASRWGDDGAHVAERSTYAAVDPAGLEVTVPLLTPRSLSFSRRSARPTVVTLVAVPPVVAKGPVVAPAGTVA
jgi:hypothetical protein